MLRIIEILLIIIFIKIELFIIKLPIKYNMNNLSDHEGEEILLRNFEEFLMERESLLTKREKIIFEREKLVKERELKCINSDGDDILNKREKLVSDREELAQERENKLYCREGMLYEREIKLSQYESIFNNIDDDEDVELTDEDFRILGLDTTDPYDEQDIKYIKTLLGSYEEIMENARCYLKLSYASK